jgi:hypothetical protein
MPWLNDRSNCPEASFQLHELAPKGGVCPQGIPGVNFDPKGECSPLHKGHKEDLHPWGSTSPLGAKLKTGLGYFIISLYPILQNLKIPMTPYRNMYIPTHIHTYLSQLPRLIDINLECYGNKKYVSQYMKPFKN